jgi:predicted nucleotidyltransferase
VPPPDEIVAAVGRVLAARPDVLEGYVFGSVARGEAGSLSHVDVAAYIDPGATASAFGADADIATDLMKALGHNRVDVVVLNRASPLLYHRVLRDGVRVVSRDLRATTTREGQALSRYCDYVPQLAKIRAAAERRERSGDFGR